MSKLKARFYRWLFLINPVHIFQGWRAFDCNNSQGQHSLIGAIREDKAREEAELKEFWTIDGRTLFPRK